MIEALPQTLATRLMVSFVAHHEQDTSGGVELSVRSVQWLLRRRSHQTGSDILGRAVEQGFLSIVERHVGRKAHCYGLGPKALEELVEWRNAGADFFGEHGVMGQWLTSGWMYEKRRGGLDISGCLVLALLGHDEASPTQLAQRSHGFISEATAIRELANLAERQIVIRDTGRSPATFRRVVYAEWFESQEKELGLASLAAKDDEKIAEERARHDYMVGLARREYHDWLKKQDCVYCVGPGTENEPIEIEHLPPKKLGGGPLTGFEIPAHQRCHGAHSSSIRTFGQPRPPQPVFTAEVVEEVWALSDEDLSEVIVSMVSEKIGHYVAAMNSGNANVGQQIAYRIGQIGAAAASPQGAFILHNTVTGEQRDLKIDRWALQKQVVAVARAWIGMNLSMADPASMLGHSALSLMRRGSTQP